MAILHIRLSGQPLALCGAKHTAWTPQALAIEAGVWSDKQGRYTTLPNESSKPRVPVCPHCQEVA